jgi:hypothetical protein
MWSAGGAAGARSLSGQVQRHQSSPAPQQTQRSEVNAFSSSSGRPPTGHVFRFGNQSNAAAGGVHTSQAQPDSTEEFPANRDGSDPRQERGSSLMSTMGFDGQGNPSASSGQNSRSENGLLSALSANRGAADTRSLNGVLLSPRSNRLSAGIY